MKRLICTLFLVTSALTSLFAQTSLTGAFKALETSKYSTGNPYLSGFSPSSAFALGAPSGGLISDGIKGSVTFNINGGYEKLSFIVGPNTGGEGSLSANSIVTIKADGRLIFDEVLFESDAPRFCTLDIKGAKQLVFTVVQLSLIHI